MKAQFGLSKKAVDTVGKELAKQLANTYILYIKTLHCHWNVEDPRFLFLHEMLEGTYEELAKMGDGLAERLRIMGLKAPGSMQAFLKLGSLKEISKELSADAMLKELSVSHEEMADNLRKLAQKAGEFGDEGLVDFLGGATRFHEKTAWMYRSHL